MKPYRLIHNKSIPAYISFICLLTLFSCAKPEKNFEEISENQLVAEKGIQLENFSKKWFLNYKEILKTGEGLLFGSTEICPKYHQFYDLGIKLTNMYTAPEVIRMELQKILNLGEYLQIVSVADKSPASLAGIREGDTIISIDGFELHGEYALQEYESLINKDMQKSYQIELAREDRKEFLTVISKLRCGYNISVDFDNNKFNAWSDGNLNINFSLRLSDWLREDESSIAFIAAHEMAHIIKGHSNLKKKNKKIAGIVGLVIDVSAYSAGINTGGRIKSFAEKIGINRYSIEFEKEADYVGMYILALNGYEYENMSIFWRKFSTEVPESIYSSKNNTHPSTADRYALLDATAKEIKQKIKNNEKLLPETELDKK